MAISISICIAVLIIVALFPKELRKVDLSPVIFLLGIVLVGMLCAVNGASPLQFTKGPNMLIIGSAMLFILSATGSTTFKILNRVPASAYKALTPVAICVGVLLLLGLTAIL